MTPIRGVALSSLSVNVAIFNVLFYLQFQIKTFNDLVYNMDEWSKSPSQMDVALWWMDGMCINLKVAATLHKVRTPYGGFWEDADEGRGFLLLAYSPPFVRPKI